jgi:hypothetical protein
MYTATPARAGSASFGSQSAAAIIAEARSAMTASGSVNATGSGIFKTGHRKVKESETGYVGSQTGDQLFRMMWSPTSSGTTELPSGFESDMAGQLYVNANETFWFSTVGLPMSQAIQATNRWIQVPADNPVYAPLAADLTMCSLVTDLFNAKTYHKGRIRVVDGVRSISISYTNAGVDKGPTTCDISLGGKHLPVAVKPGGILIHLSAWGETKTIVAPEGALPLSSQAT